MIESLEGPYGKAAFDRFEKDTGVRVLTVIAEGTGRDIQTRNKQVKVPADLKGLKIRAGRRSVCGETYGRGRVMRALADARTLDKMVEFVLRQAALQVAPPLTGVSDGVLNPYTTSLTPNTIIPVASNDTGAPSLRAVELGGNFNITQEMVRDMRERIRREMLGPEMSEGPIKTATEITISDRNRLWAMNGEYGRIQAELLTKVISRGVAILQGKGLLPAFKLNGREIAIRYTSPFARSQDNEDHGAADDDGYARAVWAADHQSRTQDRGAAELGGAQDGARHWLTPRS